MKIFFYMQICLFFLSTAVIRKILFLKKEAGSFTIVSLITATKIYTDIGDDWIIQKAASLLQTDIEKITGKKQTIIHQIFATDKNIIIIGSIDKSSLINQLVANKKSNILNTKNK